MPEGVGYPGFYDGGRPMLPIDYLRRLQGGGGPTVDGIASSAGPLAEILARAVPDAALRRAVPSPGGDSIGVRPGAPRLPFPPSGPVDPRRAFAPDQGPFGSVTGLAEPPALPGVAVGQPSPAVGNANPAALAYSAPDLAGSIGRAVPAVGGQSPGPGTSAMIAFQRGNTTPGAGTGGDFMSALRGAEAPLQSDAMSGEAVVPGGGQVVTSPRRAVPAPGPSTPRVGAPRAPTPPRRATPPPASEGVVQGPRPVYRTPPPLADPRRATAIPYRNDFNRRRAEAGRGFSRRSMPPRNAGSTDRLMGNR